MSGSFGFVDPIFVCIEIIEELDPLIVEASVLLLAAKSVVEEGFKFLFCEGSASNVIHLIQSTSIPSH